MSLYGFHYCICTKVDTPANESANEYVSEGPTIDFLLQNDVIEFIALRCNQNTLAIQFVAVHFYDGRQFDALVGMLSCRNVYGLVHVAVDCDAWVTARNDSGAKAASELQLPR